MSKTRQQGSMSSQLQEAIAHHQAGRLQQAEILYRKLPNNAAAVNLLGVIAYQSGRHDEAVLLIKKAIRANPGDATYHYNLGLSYRALQQTGEAIASYQQALKLQPRYADALNNLGVLLREQGRLDEAVACYRKVAALNPGHLDALSNLAAALREQGHADEALTWCRQALTLAPDHVLALGNLGALLNDRAQHAEAIACSQRALAIDAHCFDAHNNLGAALEALGRLEEAAPCYHQALALRPQSAKLHFNLGRLLQKQGRPDDAIAAFKQSLRYDPAFSEAYNSAGAALLGQGWLGEALAFLEAALESGGPRAGTLANLGATLLNQGKLDQAIGVLREALLLDPDQPVAQANLLFSHNYHPTMSAPAIFDVYRAGDSEHAQPLASLLPACSNLPAPGRRLKIGYVSADFRNHTVMLFAGPLITQHDRAAFDVFCYHNSRNFDAHSARLQAAVDHWVPCHAMSDQELAERIRADGIDVLVDLSGHTADNRLLVFARKSAPVQVSWLGFGYTTGLAAMDYFIGDAVFTPPGSEALFSETIYRLPQAPWAYQPQPEAPLPGPLPARARGYVTFACVSTTTRIQQPLIAAWAAILRRLPSARLRLDTRNLRDPGMQQDYLQRFGALGVPASQLEIGFSSPVWRVYQNVDIVLDCFPHNSGTTTCEALWMGLPVVTLSDRPSVGRFGAAILAAIGQTGWIAHTHDDYVECAVALAQDIDALEAIRAALRPAVAASSLLDHPAFARCMEAAYRDMWERWCAARSEERQPDLALAMEHHRAGRLAQAEALYQGLPALPAAMHLAGVIAAQTGRHDLAVARIAHAIAADPGHADYHANLGASYQALHRNAEAIAAYQQALAIAPDSALAHNNLGNALQEAGRSQEALASFHKALAARPDYADAYTNLGSVLKFLGRHDEAVASYLQAIALEPQQAAAYFNLGNAYYAQMKLNLAIDSFLAALELSPDMTVAHNNLGLVLKDIGKLDDALICFRNVLTLAPDDVNANSNMLFCVNYHPTMAPADIFATYQQWDAQQAARFAGQLAPCANAPDPQRRLKVAYLSADLRSHSVIHFAGPLLEHHDKSAIELYCYYNHHQSDSYTERMMAVADHWIACHALSDDELAARIRADGIDVLVDISGHTLGNRLLVFARKPAPVQVTWMGFGYSTGLAAMDYFIGDARFTPPGAEAVFAETIYRLPRAPWAYTPQHEAPDAGPLPARANGHVTFACLGTSTRLHDGLIAAWAAILLRLPDARLRLDTRTYADPDLCREVEARFAEFGVAPAQLQIGFTSPVWQIYQQVDIVLDCFPHNCGTTTFEALWMGIPVLSVLDRPSVGRFGASILGAIGKDGWVAPDVASYVELAVAMARDLDALEHERRSLRETMRGSSFLDHAGFAREMEAAYRAMWQQWCKGMTS